MDADTMAGFKMKGPCLDPECDCYSEFQRLESLLIRAAEVIEHGDWTGNDYEERWKNSDLIAELRKAAE